MRNIIIFILTIFPLISLAQGKITSPTKTRAKTQVNKAKIKTQSKKITESQKVQTEPQELEVSISDPSGYVNGHGYIDLGLPSGTKWATCNVGANSPQEYGDYYAWDGYEEWRKLDYRARETAKLSWHNDPARANWGFSWRMPTGNELMELKDKCTWSWVSYKGKKGYKGIGPNGNSIFLPAADHYNSDYSDYFDAGGDMGNYWSSSFRGWGGICFTFSQGYNGKYYSDLDSRQLIRAVLE